MRGYPTIWTDEMLQRLRDEYPVRFNHEIAAGLGVSIRTMLRKARELGVEKEPGFMEKRIDEIERMANRAAKKAGRPSMKGRRLNPKGEFKPGHKESPETREKRIAAIRDRAYREKIRVKYGLPQKTKWPIKNEP